jgi:hypothetical protein
MLRRRAGMSSVVAIAAVLFASGSAFSAQPVKPASDIYYLRNGDRISGRTVAETRRGYTVQTPFGRLTLPRTRVARIQRADGREEVLAPIDEAAAPLPTPTAPPPPPKPATARLTLAITGKTFWQAWDSREAGPDPALRLELRLDEEPLVAYVDRDPDPQEIPGALVNAFSFTPGPNVTPAPGVLVHPPEVNPGRIVLRLDVPTPAPAARRLRLAYQTNSGSMEEPAWKDLVSSAAEVMLDPARPASVEVRQDRGKMEYAGFPRRRMRNVDTFELKVVTPDRSEPAKASAPSP